MQSLRVAALPFVTRSLRGARSRRLWVLAAVLAMLTSLIGGWLALGNGELERGIREDMRLEQRRYEVEQRDFVLVVPDDDLQWRNAVEDREAMLLGELKQRYSPLRERMFAGHRVMQQATMHPLQAVPEQHRELYRRTAALIGDQDPAHALGRARVFDWYSPTDVAQLRTIVDRSGIPELVRYESPLDVGGAIRLVGLLASGLLLVLVIVVGPVLTGIAVAQESHENTLQPVAGTALSARQIALGLVLGAFAPVAIVAAPQLALASLAAFAGNASAFVGFIALLVPCAWAITMLALAVGLFAGRRRGTGAIGITLLAGLGVWLCAGIPLGFDRLNRSTAAVMTLLPSGGLFHGMREAFLAPAAGSYYDHDGELAWRLVAAAIASLVVGVLALRAAERRVPGRFVAPLHRSEVLIGSAVLSALTLLAMCELGGREVAFVSLAAMVMPMQILLMARVPVGDAPSGRGIVGLAGLLGEFAGFVAIHAALALAIVGSDFLVRLADPGTLHLLWALAIAPLVAIRIVAAPPKLTVSVWAGFAFVLGIIEYITGCAQIFGGGRHDDFLPLARVSPWLALLHVALLVVVPWTLVRGVRRAGTARRS
ncbi:MAG TPA: hypothetical protein VG755_01215 [Nannocystaceae bacterium]|nr:hypothetical protein [Nannocystaceae bacterium]